MKSLFSTLIACLIFTANALASPPPTEVAPQLKPHVHQPYIVQPGDTLWDIANHFFRNPHRWLKIWEQNLAITNPDLIYPGNRIWFRPRQKKSGGLQVTRSHPEVHILPVQREDRQIDRSLILSVLERQDLITTNREVGVGQVVDAPDGRLSFGAGDHLYIRLSHAADVGDYFDIFRQGEAITPPGADKPIGLLVSHVGQLQVDSKAGDLYRATITRSFEEISRGDYLKVAKAINPRITPIPPSHAMHGQIIHIRNSASEAGQHQVVAIDLGLKDGVSQGTLLTVRKKGRVINDPGRDTPQQLPSEQIATLLVISPQAAGSLALVTQSATAINLGDPVIGTPTGQQ